MISSLRSIPYLPLLGAGVQGHRFPIALVSAMLASGLTLDEIPCGKYGTLDKYVPDGDYVVIKFARWALRNSRACRISWARRCARVGEVMSIGKTYKEASRRPSEAWRSRRYGLGFATGFP